MDSRKSQRGPILVALGIGVSRLSGLGRETVTSRLLGNTAAADAFTVAMRIPNLMQNLLGEGALSASFVPLYSQALADDATSDRNHEAGRLAGAVAALLMTVTGVIVLLLVILARPITFLLAPGLSASRFELAVTLTQITALGGGFAVMSAWCQGVLNSHRRFFLAYAAPVLWNAVMIGAVLMASILAFDLDGLAGAMAWGATGGGLAQLLAQLPLAVRLARGLRLNWGRGQRQVREAARRFGPTVLSRGVVQISNYVDLALASLLAVGAVTALFRAQLVYSLPYSLFALSVAAAELPEMSRLTHDRSALAARTVANIRNVAFWLMLTAAAYLAAGDLIVGLLFEGGLFTADDTTLVSAAIAVFGLTLPASGISRILLNTCFALGDTVGPARISVIRVVVAAAVGIVVMFPLDRVIVEGGSLLNIADALRPAWALPQSEREVADVVRLGAVGLAVGAAVGSWTEMTLLSRLLRGHLTDFRPGTAVTQLLLSAIGAFVAAFTAKQAVTHLPVVVSAPLVLSVALCVYTLIALRSGIEAAILLLDQAKRLLRRSGR